MSCRGEKVGLTVRQLVRGSAGGLLLGLPPLFTMEMWALGFLVESWKIACLIGFTFAVVVGCSAFSGFRRERTWPDLLLDCVATMGIAAILSALTLFLLGRIGLDCSVRGVIGKIGLQMIPVSLGVSLAGAQLADPEDDGEEAEDLGSSVADAAPVGPHGRLFIAAGAALFVSLNIAPTEETFLLAVEIDWWLLTVIILASLLMSYAIVFYANFRGGRSKLDGTSPLDHPVTETLASYGVSLLVSAVLIWAFGRTEGATTHLVVAQIALLGVVASFGGAAGRLLLGGGRQTGS